MDSIAKVEYNLRSLTTRSVTLFPARAQIFRDIKDVPLQPGINEITIYGLSPTVDEHSIKVEGSGSAIISDIAVESLPNREIFEEIYPDEDEDKSDDEDGAGGEGDEEPDFPRSEEFKAATKKKEELEQIVRQIEDAGESADQQQRILDDYSKKLTGKDGISIDDFLESYKRVSSRISADRGTASVEGKDVRAELKEACQEWDRLSAKHNREKKQAAKGWKKAILAKTKAQIKEARREEERIKEKERVREEREGFWPKYCYAVRIQLTSNVVNTPLSSRRGSVSSEMEYAMPTAQEAESSTAQHATTTCNLVLSYVTSAASWTPSYDLLLNTATGTGTLCFDAQLNNTTSESWKGCKITLSTSQVNTSNLEETVPALVPWHISIGIPTGSDIDLLQSREERRQYSSYWQQQQPAGSKKPRYDMFGVAAGVNGNLALQDYQMQLMLLEQQNKKRLVAARKEQDRVEPPIPTPSLNPSFGSNAAVPEAQPRDRTRSHRAIQQRQQQQQQQQQQQVQFMPPIPHQSYTAGPPRPMIPQMQQQAAQQGMSVDTYQQSQMRTGDMLNDFDFDSFLHEEAEPKLEFEESLIDETGFTTTYDLPGQKNLIPKSTSSKQRVARVNFSKIMFSHTVIAKYKPVAHLSAKLLNSSKLTLLRGPVGVTLDGSFMGRTNLPRCGSGESINLGLGADPAIKVTYPRPEAKRATTGFFTKEDIKIFERCIKLENTRQASAATTAGATTAPSKAVKILVMDQIPVGDSERVRVELLKPEGLTVGGEWKATGVPGRERNEEDKDWGTAVANMRPHGEVNWTVTLKPGKALKLPLEYLVAVPIGEQAVQS